MTGNLDEVLTRAMGHHLRVAQLWEKPRGVSVSRASQRRQRLVSDEFRAELQLDGKTATGITVPSEVLDGLGGGKRLAVRVTINGHTYPRTVGTMNGVSKIPVSGAVRAAAKINAGDVFDVEVEADHTLRTVTVPDDLAAALAGDPESLAFFDDLSYSRKHAYVLWIEQAKSARG